MDQISSMTVQIRETGISSPCPFLSLPPEIRIRVYSLLFAVTTPLLIKVSPITLCLVQPDNHNTNVNDYEGPVSLSTQFLRTCRQVYDEAALYLYSMNTFLILEQDTSRFEHLIISPATRLCINKVHIRLPRPGEQPDYNAVSKAFPCVSILSVFAPGPGPSLLLAAFSLCQILVNSDIFDSQPQLELHARVAVSRKRIKESVEALKNPIHYNVAANKDHQFSNLFKPPRSFKLKSLNAFSKPLLRLGQQISGFGAIHIRGDLHPGYLHAIEEHECDFGDCGFEKIMEKSVRGEGVKEVVYAWKRKEGPAGQAAAIRGISSTDLDDVVRSFVPTLSLSFLKALQQAGLDIGLLGSMVRQSDKDPDGSYKQHGKETTNRLGRLRRSLRGSSPEIPSKEAQFEKTISRFIGDKGAEEDRAVLRQFHMPSKILATADKVLAEKESVSVFENLHTGVLLHILSFIKGNDQIMLALSCKRLASVVEASLVPKIANLTVYSPWPPRPAFVQAEGDRSGAGGLESRQMTYSNWFQAHLTSLWQSNELRSRMTKYLGRQYRWCPACKLFRLKHRAWWRELAEHENPGILKHEHVWQKLDNAIKTWRENGRSKVTSFYYSAEPPYCPIHLLLDEDAHGHRTILDPPQE
ncbi:hypothetical protein DV738_g302, partial [Chaetothyriales sp. CBS 135597]